MSSIRSKGAAIGRGLAGRLGFDIRRIEEPSVEQVYGRSAEAIFSEDPEAFLKVMVDNRRALSKFDWRVPEEFWLSSYWQYGLPLGPNSASSIEKHITYTDVMLFLGRFLQGKVRYLEIGVSIGKNLYQMCSQLRDAELTGLDIEEMSPTVSRFLQSGEVLSEWEQSTEFVDYRGKSVRKLSSLSRHVYEARNNIVYYLSADKFSDQTWRQLDGGPYNLIFSDAFHQPESILDEFRRIREGDLLDRNEFVMVWDDLGGSMSEAFRAIVDQLMTAYGVTEDSVGMFRLSGSYGGVYEPRTVGVAFRLERFRFS